MTAECSALIRRKRQLSCFIFHPPESISLRGGHRLVQGTLPHIIHLNPAAAVFINTIGIIFLFQRGFNRSFFIFFPLQNLEEMRCKGEGEVCCQHGQRRQCCKLFSCLPQGTYFFSCMRTARLFIMRFTIDISLNIVL